MKRAEYLEARLAADAAVAPIAYTGTPEQQIVQAAVAYVRAVREPWSPDETRNLQATRVSLARRYDLEGLVGRYEREQAA